MNTSLRRTGWTVLKEVLKTVRDGSDLLLPLKAALVPVVELMDIVDNVGEARDGFERAAEDIGRLVTILSQYGPERHASPLVWRRIKRIEEELHCIKQVIENKTKRSLMRRVFESWTDVKEVESVFRGLATMLNDFQIECDLHTERTVEDLDMSRLLARLQHLPDAGIDAQAGEECMQGTRVTLLDDLKVWSQDPAAPRIFWLDGMAGTGKSAIARSLCVTLRRAGILGGSFFCSRGTNRDDVKRIVPTLAVALANQIPAYKWALLEALEGNLYAGHDKVELQIDRLLRGPLRKALADALPNLVLVIDALDECSDEKATSTILAHLCQVSSNMPIKFFITSRPERHIRSQFDRNENDIRRILRLHEIEHSIVKTDISLYISHRLHEIRCSMAVSDPMYPFPAEWPSRTEVATLRLTNLGTGPGRPMNRPLDEMYMFILDRALDRNRWEEEEIHTIQRVLATILTVREQLSLGVIANLIKMTMQQIRSMLQELHAVIFLPTHDSTGAVSTFHASFGDFLTTRERSGRHFINRQTGHYDLADGCIRIMNSELLHFNVSGCRSSYLPNCKQRLLPLPKQLAYACLYWSDHIVALQDPSAHLQYLETILLRKFLFWLEVLSSLQQSNMVSMLLIQVLDVHQNKMTRSLSQFLDEANNFAVSCRLAIAMSVPHIYISALPSVHSSSRIAEVFWPQFANVPVITAMGITRSRNMLQCIESASAVSAAAISLDGARIASGSNDGVICIWDVRKGQPLFTPFKDHAERILSIAFSPDRTRVVSSSNKNVISVWDASTGQPLLKPFEGHTECVNCVRFSPDGTRIVSASNDKTIRVWNARTGEELLEPLQGHANSVTSVAYSPDGTRIVSGSEDMTICIWDAVEGQTLVGPLVGHVESVLCVAYSPDGTRIVSGSQDKTIRIWDANTGHALVGPLEGHIGWVGSVAFSQDGTRVVSGSADETVRIWDVSTGQVLLKPLQGHRNWVSSVAFCADGARVMSGSYDRTIRIWDAKTRQTVLDPLDGHTGWIYSVAYSPDGTRIVSGSGDNTIRIWNASTGQALLDPLKGHTDNVRSVAFSPDGTRIVSGSDDHTIRIWDAGTGQVLVGPLQAHTTWVGSVAFSPDGTRIASGFRNKAIRIWDARTGQALLEVHKCHTKDITSIAFSPDGTRIVSGSYGNVVRIWNASTGQALLKLKGHTKAATSVAFSPDGSRIVSGSNDMTIRIWDASTGRALLEPLEGHTQGITSVAFSPDGTRIVSGSDDGTIRIWDASTGRGWLKAIEGHKKWVGSVAFSPDGTRIVSGSGDSTIRVWSAADDGAGSTLTQPKIAFSPNPVYHPSITDLSKPHALETTLFSRQPHSRHSDCADLLHQNHDSFPCVDDSFDPRSLYDRARNMDPRDVFSSNGDGWIIGPRGELVLWVPVEYLPGLWWPRNLLIIGQSRVQLNLKNFVHGTEWTNCYTPRRNC
ncbi:hypothetical protein CERSUDRAFT_95078 [Gelatoporia subvermispora B]|uniref:NACHT domain-containing protein n=1 Tax=Ceriporiopsis subvermispora (strain B) TaxID=914234 RepID=M2RDA6_CERS8|nr:hypothetical protein CERSUDRAFT_95078 [Gelatoporia subvermispora B]